MNFARKYRPQSFEETVGQQLIVRVLKNAIEMGKIGKDITALLFAGQRGIGKTTLARIVAKSLNCKEGPTPEPCNKCVNCTEITESRSIDVLEIDGASNRGIDEIRNLREAVRLVPVHSKFKVIIIDEVHMLTNEAFNALLKTLEEPPSNVIFIFATTESHRIPETIISRTLSFEFPLIKEEEIFTRLENVCKKEKINADKNALMRLALSSRGSLRDALTLLEKVYMYKPDNITLKDVEELLGLIGDEPFLEIIMCIHNRDIKGGLQILDALIGKGYEETNLVRSFIETLRKIIRAKAQGKRDLFPEDILRYETLDLVRFMKILLETENLIRWSSYPRILIEFALARMTYLPTAFEVEKYLSALSVVAEEKDKFQSESPVPVKKETEIPSPWKTFIQEVESENKLLAGILSSLNSTFTGKEVRIKGSATALNQIEEKKDYLQKKLNDVFKREIKIELTYLQEETKNPIIGYMERELELELMRREG